MKNFAVYLSAIVLAGVLSAAGVLVFSDSEDSAFADAAPGDFAGIEIDGLIYTLTSEGKASVTGYTGSPADVVIPSSVEYESESYSVTSVASKAFYQCASLKSADLGSVTSVGSSAFAYCKNLSSVDLGDSMKTISSYAFNRCIKLAEIATADSAGTLSAIGNYSFNQCNKISEISIPMGIKTIYSKAFSMTFKDLDGSVLPVSADSLRGFTYANVDGDLFRVLDIVPGTEFPIGSLVYTVTSVEPYKAEVSGYIGSIKAAYVPETVLFEGIEFKVTSIGEKAFYKCKALKTVEAPFVTYIGKNAFAVCSNLESVYLEKVKTIDQWAFSYCSKLSEIHFGTALTIIKASAFYKCYSITYAELPDSLKTISPSAFKECSGLISVQFGSSLKSVSPTAFAGITFMESNVVVNDADSLRGKLFFQSGDPDSRILKCLVDYKILLMNTVSGDDSSINGWYYAQATSPVEALCIALDSAEIEYVGFNYDTESVYFNSSRTISDWSFGEWKSDGTYFGAQMAVWNYNEEDGWHLGDAFGAPCGVYQPAHKSGAIDTVFILSHENYLDVDGPAAAEMGISNEGVYPAAADYDLVYDGETGGYADADAAMIAWYRVVSWSMGYIVPDLEEYGISLAKGSEYEDVIDAAFDW
ncbi:MAG: leucine-rich repeat domain-containing protein, partial [Candidatus Methanomethylophilaceae archaeon]|nr:leucine-rich repeat domain-containing protein [Candidatus Methanomethylophilaceae archaeon]